MPRNKRVFPFFLDGGIQEFVGNSGNSRTGSWNGTSSYVELKSDSSSTFNIGIKDSYDRPIEHGTMLVVKKVDTDATIHTVNWDAEYSSETEGDSTVLRNDGDAVLLLFKGPSTSNDKGEWVNISSASFDNQLRGAVTIQGSTVMGNNFDDSTRQIGHFVQRVYPVDKDGNDQSVTTEEVIKKQFIVHTPATANDSIILPSAATIVNTMGIQDDSVIFSVYNDGSVVSDIEMGTGGTARGTVTGLAAGQLHRFMLRVTDNTDSSEAYDVYAL